MATVLPGCSKALELLPPGRWKIPPPVLLQLRAFLLVLDLWGQVVLEVTHVSDLVLHNWGKE